MTADPPSFHSWSGPADVTAWPSTLTARVVTPGAAPRLHGYDVESDLARYYRPTDVTLLALTGELPSDAASAGFAVAWTFLAAISVAEAPAHAAVLARLCGASQSSLVNVTAVALTEQARALVAEHTPLLRWLDAGALTTLPPGFAASGPAELATLDRLGAALSPTGLRVAALDHRPSRTAALLCVLHACGLTRAEPIISTFVATRLPVAIAEGMAARVADFRNYPTDLPAYRYHEGP